MTKQYVCSIIKARNIYMQIIQCVLKRFLTDFTAYCFLCFRGLVVIEHSKLNATLQVSFLQVTCLRSTVVLRWLTPSLYML